ncbi:hypothetical protein HQQ80_17200 [Microbacteriaceae bacterium VKM Ac-2855]|nr:hypothetical protein [Microbacteriaceae bacterium VKM Ac-2855]
MSIEQWWPRLQPSTQEWLIANNGDVLPATILDEIGRVQAEARTSPSLSDAEIDWIEATANGEHPRIE